MATFRSLLLFGGATLAMAACGNIDNAFDCNAVCDKYKSCYDSNYNTSACYDRCRSSSALDSNHQRKVDECHACMDGRDCTATAFNCVSECSTVVP